MRVSHRLQMMLDPRANSAWPACAADISVVTGLKIECTQTAYLKTLHLEQFQNQDIRAFFVRQVHVVICTPSRWRCQHLTQRFLFTWPSLSAVKLSARPTPHYHTNVNPMMPIKQWHRPNSSRVSRDRRRDVGRPSTSDSESRAFLFLRREGGPAGKISRTQTSSWSWCPQVMRCSQVESSTPTVQSMPKLPGSVSILSSLPKNWLLSGGAT